MTRKRIIVALGIIGIVGLAVAIPWSIVAGGDDDQKGRHYRIDGTWTGVNDSGIRFLLTMIPAGPVTNKGSFLMEVIDWTDPSYGGLFPGASPVKSIVMQGNWVRSGRKTYKSTGVLYGRNEFSEIVHILVGAGSGVFTDADTIVDTGQVSVYDAEQDGDGDGFPDAEAVPGLEYTTVFTFKRMPLLSP